MRNIPSVTSSASSPSTDLPTKLYGSNIGDLFMVTKDVYCWEDNWKNLKKLKRNTIITVLGHIFGIRDGATVRVLCKYGIRYVGASYDGYVKMSS
jgi:hypothetical protein